uniref:Replication termination factor 2 n=1 Tax=Caenorhabditis tropicalis TaxID=1561998 RepID=A0A1I7UNX8_9PELO
MGADGGTIPKRCELVKKKKKVEKLDKHVKNATKWRNCQLTQLPLKKPVIACRFGKLYNKEDVINAILSKTIAKSAAASHIKGPKDFIELKLTDNKDYKRGDVKGDDYDDVNQTEFICPITNVPMNGIQSFLVNWQCGCVYSEKAQQEVKSTNCHVCGGPYDADKMVILNPEPEQLELYKVKWEAEKAEKAAAKKAKKSAQDVVPEGPKQENPVGKHIDLKKKLEFNKITASSSSAAGASSSSSSDRKAEKRKAQSSDIQSDPTKSDTYKKLFTTCEAAKKKPDGHWVTYNPLYY